LEQFCEFDSQGKQLTPEGWREVAALFVTPTAPRLDEIIVVRDFVVSHPVQKGKNVEFYVEYITLGQITPSLGLFSHLPAVKVRSGFELILTDEPSQPTSIQAGPPQPVPTKWRIKGNPPEPHLTVETAIRYIAELRDKTVDPVIKKNATRALIRLKSLH